jgi:hypothetical protein
MLAYISWTSRRLLPLTDHEYNFNALNLGWAVGRVLFREERQTVAAVVSAIQNPTSVRTFGGHILMLGGSLWLNGCTS